MSFLWHGLTEQGAQVPVQVDAQGRVIAVDGTPGVSNWSRTGTSLFPVNLGDKVGIGTALPQVPLEVKGDARFYNATDASSAILDIKADTSSPNGVTLDVAYFGANGYGPLKFATSDTERLQITKDGNVLLGGTLPSAPNTSLNADGSGTFAGNVTAANITFRSADPAFYVPNERSESYEGTDTYTGPELNLLEEIVRLEALVKHLYDVLRQNPPAGWDVWDGNDDVLRQLRK